MYDQTGSTEENPFSGFENEDFFSGFQGFGGGRGGRGRNPMGGGAGGFESIFEDLFGFQKEEQRSENMAEKIIIRAELDFNDAVNGTQKVKPIEFRLLLIRRKGPALPAKGANRSQGQTPRSAELAKELAI